MISLHLSLRKHLAVIFGIGLSSLAWSQASLPLYEPFDYSPGNLVGKTIEGGQWTQTGSNSASPVQVVSNSLS